MKVVLVAVVFTWVRGLVLSGDLVGTTWRTWKTAVPFDQDQDLPLKIFEQLMQVNSRKLNLMKQNLTVDETKKQAIVELQNKLTAFKTASSALDDSSVLKSFKAVTSDSDIITAEASSDAYEGNLKEAATWLWSKAVL